MKKTNGFLLVWLFGSFLLSAQNHPNPFKTVEFFFDAFHAKDSLALRQAFSKQARLMRSSDHNGESILKPSNIKRFIQSVSTRPSQPVWRESLGKPIVHQQQHLAMVWVPFQFFLDQNLSHCGINAFTLIWEDKRWKILSLIDTATRNCESQ